MTGEATFLKKEKVLEPSWYEGDPEKIQGGIRRFTMEIDKEVWYVKLTGQFVFFNEFETKLLLKRMKSAKQKTEDIKTVSMLFHTLDNPSVKNISEVSCISKFFVNKVIEKYLIKKEEVGV